MKMNLFTAFVAGLVLLSGPDAVSAQDSAIKVVPVELFTCNYNDGKGPADLDAVIDKWTVWADKKKIEDYAAWTLTPYYFGQKQEFDVIWLGAGKDGAALGRAQDAYMAENEGLHQAFSEVLSCDAHGNFASIRFKAGEQGKTPENSILTFSDCTYKEGASFSSLGAAMNDWAQYLTDAGSTSSIFAWYPAYGGGGEEFSFKWLETYKNLADLGAGFDRFGSGSGWVTYNRLLGHLIDCDASRAYVAKSRRYVQLR
ncbi:hypothetical protein ACFL00_02000 [Pseudomonadota bacterium]